MKGEQDQKALQCYEEAMKWLQVIFLKDTSFSFSTLACEKALCPCLLLTKHVAISINPLSFDHVLVSCT
jgi:hypothetical protein